MAENPYESPTAVAASLSTAGMRVEGKYLIVQSGAVLPAFCVKTNAALPEQEMHQRRLSWCPPIVGVLILASGLFLILVYFIVRKHCSMTFGVSAAIRRKYKRRIVLKVLSVIVLFFALPFAAGIDSTPVIITVFVLFLVAVVSLFVGHSPLTIANHRKGEFWISGCCQDFLARISKTT